MPPAIDAQIRAQVIKEWFSGHTRDEIAANNEIGAGTVSNIISEWKEGIDSIESDSIRELALFSRREGIIMSDLASHARLINYIKRLGANLDQIESFIANISDSQNPQKLIETANQIAHLSKSDSVPLDMLDGHIEGQRDERRRIKEEIEKAGAILESKNVDIQTIEEYKKFEEELKKHGLSIHTPRILVSILQAINQMGYNAGKIITELGHIKSLRQTERQLKNNCKMLEARLYRCRDVLPLCEEIISFGIGIGELLAFSCCCY